MVLRIRKISINEILILALLLIGITNTIPLVQVSMSMAVFLVYSFVNRKVIFALTKARKWALSSLMAIILLYLIQSLVVGGELNQRMSALIYILMIFWGCICVFFLDNTASEYILFKAILNFNIILEAIYIARIIIYGLPKDRAYNNVIVGMSVNYVLTILLISYPIIRYYYKNVLENIDMRLTVYIVAVIIILATSGSRSSFVSVLWLAATEFLINGNVKRLVKTVLVVIGGLVVMWICYYRIDYVREMVDRSFGVFVGSERVRDPRNVMWSLAIEKIKRNALLGNGTVQIFYVYINRAVHNFWLECTMAVGVLGTVLFSGINLSYIRMSFKNTGINERICITQLLGIFFIVGFVQPFFSTGIICTEIFWLSTMLIRHNLEGKGK